SSMTMAAVGDSWPEARVVMVLMEIVSFHGVISWPGGVRAPTGPLLFLILKSGSRCVHSVCKLLGTTGDDR
ncbi:MAG TPA: hypothetical protein VJW23_06630, partial [Propionibacteriaceae bacterium]|nr:hypothetical protein [Propionibacteriaceae bacterium]